MDGPPQERFLAAVALGLSEGLLMVDADTMAVRWASPSVGRLLGLDPATLVGRTTFELQHPDDAEVSRAHHVQRETDSLPVWHAIRRVRHADGGYRLLDCTSVDLSSNPDVAGLVITLRDATERHQAWETERRLQALVENAQDALIVYGRDLTVVYASPSAHELMDDLNGTLLDHINRYVDAAELDSVVSNYDLAIAGLRAPIERLLWLTRTDGVGHWVRIRAANLLDDPAVAGVVLNLRDVSAQVALENELRDAARRDPLTRLPNRARIIDELQYALDASEDPSKVVVLFLDLDRFKVVNDSFGHATGDRVLVELGARLADAIGSNGTLGRFGGDEYVVVACIENPVEAVALAGLITQAASQPFNVTGPDHEVAEVFLSGSVGIALGSPGVDPAMLLHHADAAMYRAKARGPGTWELYDEEMRRAALARLTLEAELARALDDEGFKLWYQPIVDVASGQVRGFEALARWPRRDRGMVSPTEFIPVAEETGGIHRLGAWALETACAQLRAWQSTSVAGLGVAVNLSPRQLTRDELAGEVADVLDRCGVDPALLSLEITETLLMDDLELAVKALSRLRDTGVRLALDDFGTGWSSLTYLQSVPVDVVKIDRSFIHGVAASDDDRAIVGAVVSMCRALGKSVVAEGVETEAQFRALRGLGCTQAQGFLFAKPLPAVDVPGWLERYGRAGNRDPDA